MKQLINQSSNITFGGNALSKVRLSGSDAHNVEKVTKLMVDVIKRSKRLWRKEINDWQAGRFARYNVEIPNTHFLDEVYDDVMMDGHLTGVTGNRMLRTTNKKYIFSINNVKDDNLSKFIEDKSWFEYTLENAFNSVYRGHSLLWVKDWTKGEIKEIELIPRGLVVPEKNCLKHDYDSVTGIDFRELNDILWYAQFYDNVGLLEKAAPYTILKRHSWGSWDEFEELFGVPIRIAKIASQSEVVKNEVADWLEQMGSAAYGVFPIGTEVDIKENSKSDSFNVFYQKIKALDAELSKLVVHQTMTTENGASKAQGNVHENTLKELVYADEKKMLAFLNDVVIPAMRALGYKIPDNAKISVEQTKDSSEQIAIDGVLLSNGYILKKEYLEGVYGCEIEAMPQQNTSNTAGKL